MKLNGILIEWVGPVKYNIYNIYCSIVVIVKQVKIRCLEDYEKRRIFWQVFTKSDTCNSNSNSRFDYWFNYNFISIFFPLLFQFKGTFYIYIFFMFFWRCSLFSIWFVSVPELLYELYIIFSKYLRNDNINFKNNLNLVISK